MSSGGGRREEDFNIWHDKEVRFDVAASALNPGRGEVPLQTLAPVEDHKGNNGAPGRLTFTNLRIIWYLAKSNKVNLSIGLGCVISVSTAKTKSYLLKGEGSSIVMMTRFNNSRFEFVFTTEADKTKQAVATLEVGWKSLHSALASHLGSTVHGCRYLQARRVKTQRR